jgi:hypothetical protein
VLKADGAPAVDGEVDVVPVGVPDGHSVRSGLKGSAEVPPGLAKCPGDPLAGLFWAGGDDVG